MGSTGGWDWGKLFCKDCCFSLLLRFLLLVIVLSISWMLPGGRAASLFYAPLLLLASPCFCLALFVWSVVFLLLFSLVPPEYTAPLYHGLSYAIALSAAWHRSLSSASIRHHFLAGSHATPVRTVLLLLSLCALAGLFLVRVPLWQPILWSTTLALMRREIPRAETACPHVSLAEVLLLAIMIALSLVGLELGARWVVPAPEATVCDFRMEHPQAAHTLRPGADSWHNLGDCDGTQTRIAIHISPQGLRDRTYASKREGEYRILVLGDSFAMGWGLPIEATISRQLEARLGALVDGYDVTVINGGVENYGPWQEHIFLLERGLTLEPDLVLHQLFPQNDIENTLAQFGKYPQAYNREAVKVTAWWAHRTHPLGRFEEVLRRASGLYRLTSKAFGLRYILPEFRFFRPRGMVTLPTSADRSFRVELCLREWYPVLDEGWQLFEQDVLSVKRTCASHGAAYMAFAIADLSNVEDVKWRDCTSKLGEDAYERYKAVRLGQEFFLREDIAHVDLRPAFSTYPEREELYFPCDGHLTRKGVQLLTEALAPEVARHIAAHDLAEDLVRSPGT